MTDVTSFLASSDFEKHPPAKFRSHGDKVAGTITSEPRVVEVPSFDDETVKVAKLVIEVDTGIPYVPAKPDDPDDRALSGDTIRSIWINKGKMATAINQAVKAAGVTQIQEGGKIVVQYVGDGTPTKKHFNPPKEYAAKYEPPKGGIDLDDF